jgi:uncharacterized repeat protein (TIGR01451 family)
MMRRAAIILLLISVWTGVSLAQRAPVAGDDYGHLVIDSADADCSYQFVDIEGSGAPLSWTASGADPAADDGGAALTLTQPFEFYGVTVSELVVSTNGYLAFGAAIGTEDGGDFSNDAQLPAIPDNDLGVAARAMVYHDDLSGFMSGGTASWQYFAACPRDSDALGPEECTVVQWSDWSIAAAGSTFDMQALLYHESFEIVFQVKPAAATLDQGTIGVQDSTAQSAAQYRPSAALSSDIAICVFDPQFPTAGPQADLQLTKSHKFEDAQPAGDVSYRITVLNAGPSPVQSATVEDPLAAGLSACDWSCSASDGAACPLSGSGAININVDIPALAWIELTLTCDVAAGGGTILNSATVTTPPAVVDPELGNNVDTDPLFTTAGRDDQLRLWLDGGELELSWQGSCLTSDVDHEIYRGPMGNFVDYEPLVCSTGGLPSHRLATPTASEYYIVVPTNLTFEGSYGEASSGARAAAAQACRPRSIGACP